MDPKDIFERRSRGIGPMEPAPKNPGLMESVEEAIFERLPLPIKETLPRALEFRRQTESWFSFPYHCLMNVEYYPHDRLVLAFSTHNVVIRGRNLQRVYEGIQQQTCAVLEEMGRAARLAASETDWEVHVIAIEKLGAGKPKAAPCPEGGPVRRK